LELLFFLSDLALTLYIGDNLCLFFFVESLVVELAEIGVELGILLFDLLFVQGVNFFELSWEI